MSKLARRALVLGAVIALLGVGSYAIAGSGTNNFKGTLDGYEENADVSTSGWGSFDARLSSDGSTLRWTLTYGDLEGAVTQAHVHFGKRAVNGGVSYFLCSNLGNGPAGTQPCPPSGTIEGEVDAADVIGPAAQGIEPGALAEIVAARRAGHTYANVHSTKWPGGEIRAQLNDKGERRG